MNICGECDRPLPQSATKCGCGWKLPARSPLHIQCAHEACEIQAIVKLKTSTGWANLCEPHYVAHFQARAVATFTAMGLDRWHDESREEWRSRVGEYMKLIVKRRPMKSEEAECETEKL